MDGGSWARELGKNLRDPSLLTRREGGGYEGVIPKKGYQRGGTQKCFMQEGGDER